MDIVLVIGLILTNIAWLIFFKNHLDADKRERWEYQERIRKPDIPKAPPTLTQYEKDQLKQMKSLAEEKHEDEFDLVGRIDPPTPLREDSKK